MMRRSKLLWAILLIVGALGVASCADSNIDDGDAADILLQVLGVNNPAITGNVDLGTCSISGTDCLTNDNCPIGEVCNPPIAGDCTIAEWSVQMDNVPKSSGAGTSPFNDVVLATVTIMYSGGYAADVVLPLGVTIPADSSASVSFFPLSIADLTAGGDNTSVDLTMLFAGVTISGDSVAVATAAQLIIEDCIP